MKAEYVIYIIVISSNDYYSLILIYVIIDKVMENKLDVFDNVREKIRNKLVDYPDFPKKGILFKDIMPLFKDPGLINDLALAIATHFKNCKIDAIAACEARGFLFGVIVSIHMNIPFVAIRKKGKLPGECISATFIKEYGEDIFEVQKGSFKSGDRVLILDDLLATGGSMSAAINVIEKAGANPVNAFCLIELTELKGLDKLPKSTTFEAMIKI
uniref:Adenine phosphoribosyltransferase n=1 Tax=Strongyloides venezuelensis TaxID=75913 RepID=A0A0K0F8Q4_STRVS